jgi:hypothetical protein
MSSPSYREVWEKRFRTNREGFIQVATWDPFKDWELSTAPENRAEENLLDALEILYGHGDADLARRFLEHCLLIAERTLAEDKLRSPRCKDNYPKNRGILIRARTYARAILGSPLEEVALLEASAEFERACAEYPKHKWDDYREETFLAAVRLAIIGGDGEQVKRLLRRRRLFRWHPEQDELLRALASSLQASSPQKDELFKARFKAYFDRVRDPNYNPQAFSRVPILRLELGILQDKYLFSSDRVVDLQRTIDAIAA